MHRDVRTSSPLTGLLDVTQSSVEPPALPGSEFSVWFAESERDRAEVAAFVDSIYVKSFGGRPPLADAYVAVEFRGTLVSCIGLEWEGADGRLGIERMYRLDRSRLPLALSGAVQFVRWASKMPRAGRHVLYAAAVFGLARGSSVGLVEHNDKVHQHCQKLGLRFHDIPHEGVDLSTLHGEGWLCYPKGTMNPYLIELEQIRRALGPGAVGLSFRGQGVGAPS